MIGQSGQAEANLDRLLAADPLDGQAQIVRSSLRRQTGQANHLAELKAGVARADDGLNRVTIRFALAKELEDLGRDEECFEQLAAANGWVRGAMDFDVAADVAVLEALGRGSPMPTRTPHDKGEAAIFVIGLPRSGTTLVERILASHPDVTAGGETGAFASVVVAADRALEGGAPADRLDFVRRAERLDEERLGERYLDMLRGQIGTARRFSDKTPDNYLYAGLISRALPQSRFLLLERYPMDSCYAMFKTLFNQAYPFSYDLDDLARYYIAWRDLMGRWKERLGPSMLTVSYESLVRNQEVERVVCQHL